MGGTRMRYGANYRRSARMRLAAACKPALALLAGILLTGPASAQSGEPIKIGYSMALTGGLAPNGKAALLAQRIWEEDVNAKSGLLRRPGKLIYYDDKNAPAQVPPIYNKLLHVDKGQLIIRPYSSAPN